VMSAVLVFGGKVPPHSAFICFPSNTCLITFSNFAAPSVEWQDQVKSQDFINELYDSFISAPEISLLPMTAAVLFPTKRLSLQAVCFLFNSN